jgi:hypothetical protein
MLDSGYWRLVPIAIGTGNLGCSILGSSNQDPESLEFHVKIELVLGQKLRMSNLHQIF